MPTPENVDKARAAVGKIGLDTSALKGVLADVHGEGYVTGTHTALGALPASVDAVGPTWEADIDWSNWAPGNAGAAAELAGKDAGRGLAKMLDDADVTIKGIGDFTMERLAQTLAEGVDAGESIADLTDRVAAALGDESRAEMIARTESARAQTVATLDTYRQNGMGGRQWLAADDAEEDCAAYDGVIVAMDDDFDEGDPPLHPNCRCTISPVLASEMDSSDGGDEGE